MSSAGAHPPDDNSMAENEEDGQQQQRQDERPYTSLVPQCLACLAATIGSLVMGASIGPMLNYCVLTMTIE